MRRQRKTVIQFICLSYRKSADIGTKNKIRINCGHNAFMLCLCIMHVEQC